MRFWPQSQKDDKQTGSEDYNKRAPSHRTIMARPAALGNVRLKAAFIARRAGHHCAPRHIASENDHVDVQALREKAAEVKAK
jgi:hypothetical protein